MKKIEPSEYAIHVGIVRLLNLCAAPGVAYWHPANGEARSKITAARLKAMGVRRGVPDLELSLVDGRPAFIEVKSKKGRLTPEQQEFKARCDRLGIPYAVVRSIDQAQAVLTSWGAIVGGLLPFRGTQEEGELRQGGAGRVKAPGPVTSSPRAAASGA
jgi:VRR-NUC domain